MSKSIQEIKHEFNLASGAKLKDLCQLYEGDPRSGVQSLIKKAKNQEKKLEQEYARLEAMAIYEKKYSQIPYIAGIDEAGTSGRACGCRRGDSSEGLPDFIFK